MIELALDLTLDFAWFVTWVGGSLALLGLCWVVVRDWIAPLFAPRSRT